MSCSELLPFFDMFLQPLCCKEVSEVTLQNIGSVKPPFVNLALSWTMVHGSPPKACLPPLLHDQMCAQLGDQYVCLCLCLLACVIPAQRHVSLSTFIIRSDSGCTMNVSTAVA